MPIYSENEGRHPGALPWPYHPCWGVDANGFDIGDCEAVDTDTGECFYFARNESGAVLFQGDDVVIRTEKRPTPILFFPDKRGI